MKQLWTYIKQKKSDDNIIPPIKSDGALHQDSVDKADIQAIPNGIFIEVRK